VKARRKLFPIMMLALVAGCSPAASDHADDRDRARPAQPSALAQAPPAPALPDAPPLLDRPPPPPILPNADPAMAGDPPAPEWTDDAEQVAAANRAMIGSNGGGARIATVASASPAYVPDLPPGAGAADARPFPDEVTRYMVDRDSCDHFRGEDAHDADRRAFLEESVAELCTGTDARLAMLRHRYAQDGAVMAALGGYEDEIEGNASN